MSKNKKHRGFTLIELLVVIAIIGILASIVLVSLGGARSKARDARRESDIRQISLAMEMIYDDDIAYATTEVSGANLVVPWSISDYLDPVPTDPGGGAAIGCNDSANVGYMSFDNTGNRDQYCIFACLEEAGYYFMASEKGTKKENASPTDYTCDLP